MTVEIELIDGNPEINIEEGFAPQGLRGNGIESIEQNEDYSLTITDTDGNTYKTDPVRGLPGNGIESAELNDNYTLTLTFTDGDSYTTPVIRGARGQGFVTNLIDGTLNPDVSSSSKYPQILDFGVTNVTYQATASVSVHGIRATLTNQDMPAGVIFGGSYGPGGSVSGGGTVSDDSCGIRPGRKYTMSFDGKWKALSADTRDDTQYVRAYVSYFGRQISGETFDMIPITPEDKGVERSGRCEFTFTVPEQCTVCQIQISAGTRAFSSPKRHAVGDYFELSNLKLEEGSEATPWEPSYLEMRGDKGDTGNGIVGTEKTGTSGLVDTYTMSYDNGDSDTFTVTNGQDGTDGHSPSVTASKSGGTTTISVDDEPIATILDGVDGTDGTDGHSPVMTASKSQGVTTISVDSEPIATINDGTDGHSPEITTSKSGTTTTILSDGEPIGTVDDGDDYILTSQDKTDIAAQVRDVYVETVSGSAVSITGVDNHRYMCGTVSSISITPPVSGMIDVVFTSGSTAAVLTLPSTVKMPEWFDSTALETDTVYEINITDGVYGTVMVWSS